MIISKGVGNAFPCKYCSW